MPSAGWAGYLLRLLAGNLAMGLLLAHVAVGLPWESWGSQQRIALLLLWLGAGAAGYFACLWLCGLRPAHLRLREAG